MKKIGTAIALIAFVLAVVGALVIGAARATGNTCADQAMQARAIMTDRQYHNAYIEVMYREQITDEGRALVLAAFQRPAFKTVGFREDAIERFTNETFTKCLAK